MAAVFSLWFVPKCYKQGQSSSGVEELSGVQLSEVAGWWVREFSWKSTCDERTRGLVWNGSQPGTQLVVSWQELATGGCDKGTWVRETEESLLLEAVASKRLAEPVIDWGH
jgi:hypothetical protein